MKRKAWYLFFALTAVILIVVGLSYWAFHMAMRAETNVRYSGLQGMVASQLDKTIRGMEMSAINVFYEVEKHLDSPQSVIEALEGESYLNPDVRGYFAAFEPNYFKEKGTWFEPYVHHNDTMSFEMTQVGSARHDYHQSKWYLRAKDTKQAFWSDPYYYYDGTDISGHYSTFVKPVFDKNDQLACVCGADVTFEWLSKELIRINEFCRNAQQVNKYRMMRDFEFFSLVLTKEGTCIVHPADLNMPITDKGVLTDMEQQRTGVVDMVVGGVPSKVFYGPIEGIDWIVAVVVPQDDIQKPFTYMGILLAAIAIIGIIVVFVICRRIKYAEKD